MVTLDQLGIAQVAQLCTIRMLSAALAAAIEIRLNARLHDGYFLYFAPILFQRFNLHTYK
jgi:hypothetical protein